MLYECMKPKALDYSTKKMGAEERTQFVQQLFRMHYRQMYKLAAMLLHDDAESKDIIHDVFAQLLSSPNIELQRNTAEAYLLAAVRNRCLNVIRGRKIQERVKQLYLLELDQSVPETDTLLEELKTLSKGIAQLMPPVCRRVIELHFNDGMTFREIAAHLGVSETTVYKYLRNALQQLRNHLKKDCRYE